MLLHIKIDISLSLNMTFMESFETAYYYFNLSLNIFLNFATFGAITIEQ